MDYILLSALAPLLVASVFVSYDIACQFKVNFEERMVDLPSDLQLPQDVDIGWGIPKCHCPMHKLPCQAPHSLNFKPGVGRTDGEGIERSWSELNRVANSTKEMGPGSRHDTLDDHLGHHNFRKHVGLGRFFLVMFYYASLICFYSQGGVCIRGSCSPLLNRSGSKRYSTNSTNRYGHSRGWKRNGPTWCWHGKRIQHRKTPTSPWYPVS